MLRIGGGGKERETHPQNGSVAEQASKKRRLKDPLCDQDARKDYRKGHGGRDAQKGLGKKSKKQLLGLKKFGRHGHG